jgi:hypothetical protein
MPHLGGARLQFEKAQPEVAAARASDGDVVVPVVDVESNPVQAGALIGPGDGDGQRASRSA